MMMMTMMMVLAPPNKFLEGGDRIPTEDDFVHCLDCGVETLADVMSLTLRWMCCF